MNSCIDVFLSIPYQQNKMRSRKFQVKPKAFVRCLFYFIIMDLLNDNSYISLLAANIAEFVDQNEMCEKLILAGLWKKCWWNILPYFAKELCHSCLKANGRWPWYRVPEKGLKGLLFVATTPLCIDGADPCNFPTNMTTQNETRTHAHMHAQYIFSICIISRSQWHRELLSPGLISQNADANCLLTTAIFFRCNLCCHWM